MGAGLSVAEGQLAWPATAHMDREQTRWPPSRPYITERIKRFGEYATDGLTDPPAAFDPRLDLSAPVTGEAPATADQAA